MTAHRVDPTLGHKDAAGCRRMIAGNPADHQT
jgi:hypothetical protein